ncbi:hypothetical protein HK102_000075, partial [Quaeritorhiza haematococci]
MGAAAGEGIDRHVLTDADLDIIDLLHGVKSPETTRMRWSELESTGGFRVVEGRDGFSPDHPEDVDLDVQFERSDSRESSAISENHGLDGLAPSQEFIKILNHNAATIQVWYRYRKARRLRELKRLQTLLEAKRKVLGTSLASTSKTTIAKVKARIKRKVVGDTKSGMSDNTESSEPESPLKRGANRSDETLVADDLTGDPPAPFDDNQCAPSQSQTSPQVSAPNKSDEPGSCSGEETKEGDHDDCNPNKGKGDEIVRKNEAKGHITSSASSSSVSTIGSKESQTTSVDGRKSVRKGKMTSSASSSSVSTLGSKESQTTNGSGRKNEENHQIVSSASSSSVSTLGSKEFNTASEEKICDVPIADFGAETQSEITTGGEADLSRWNKQPKCDLPQGATEFIIEAFQCSDDEFKEMKKIQERTSMLLGP